MEKKKKKGKLIKILIGVAIAVFVTFIIATFAIANYLVGYAIGKGGDGGDRNVSLEVATEDGYAKKIQDGIKVQEALNEDFIKNVKSEKLSIKAKDGVDLVGFYYPAKQQNENKWVILIHGYRSNNKSRIGWGQQYHERGYQVLIPDLRGLGESGGDYIGMGWLDKEDIKEWIDYIIKRDANAQIVVQGVSMGAATTMMLSGDKTPENVKAFVEDCGYTSVWDIFAQELSMRFKLPTFPILNAASFIAKQKAGYSFEEASALEQVKKAEKPMLFIHGTADDFVPFEMQKKLYEAKLGDNKEMLVVEGAGHSESDALLGKEYWDAVFSFLNKYVN